MRPLGVFHSTVLVSEAHYERYSLPYKTQSQGLVPVANYRSIWNPIFWTPGVELNLHKPSAGMSGSAFRFTPSTLQGGQRLFALIVLFLLAATPALCATT